MSCGKTTNINELLDSISQGVVFTVEYPIHLGCLCEKKNVLRRSAESSSIISHHYQENFYFSTPHVKSAFSIIHIPRSRKLITWYKQDVEQKL